MSISCKENGFCDFLFLSLFSLKKKGFQDDILCITFVFLVVAFVLTHDIQAEQLFLFSRYACWVT